MEADDVERCDVGLDRPPVESQEHHGSWSSCGVHMDHGGWRSSFDFIRTKRGLIFHL